MTMQKLFFFSLCIFFSFSTFGQDLPLKPGSGFENLKIGDSFESVRETLGFGKKKTYEKYLADELFDREPGEALECLIGFDYYMKIEYLVTLPILYVYFKDDKVIQIKSTSFPEYYNPICEDVVIGDDLKFWSGVDKMHAVLGKEDVFINEDYLILETFGYLSKGIAFSAREKQIRMIHVFRPVTGSEKSKIIDELQN